MVPNCGKNNGPHPHGTHLESVAQSLCSKRDAVCSRLQQVVEAGSRCSATDASRVPGPPTKTQRGEKKPFRHRQDLALHTPSTNSPHVDHRGDLDEDARKVLRGQPKQATWSTDSGTRWEVGKGTRLLQKSTLAVPLPDAGTGILWSTNIKDSDCSLLAASATVHLSNHNQRASLTMGTVARRACHAGISWGGPRGFIATHHAPATGACDSGNTSTGTM
jgi:hypothetical protein